jgi:hypothetical protein
MPSLWTLSERSSSFGYRTNYLWSMWKMCCLNGILLKLNLDFIYRLIVYWRFVWTNLAFSRLLFPTCRPSESTAGLIDEGFLSHSFKGETCLSVRQMYNEVEYRIREQLENLTAEQNKHYQHLACANNQSTTYEECNPIFNGTK